MTPSPVPARALALVTLTLTALAGCVGTPASEPAAPTAPFEYTILTDPPERTPSSSPPLLVEEAVTLEPGASFSAPFDVAPGRVEINARILLRTGRADGIALRVLDSNGVDVAERDAELQRGYDTIRVLIPRDGATSERWQIVVENEGSTIVSGTARVHATSAE